MVAPFLFPITQYLNFIIRGVFNMRKTISYLYKLAFTDLCTGLSNRNAYEEKMQRLRKGYDNLRKLQIVFIDIDNMKFINDTYGHYAGDAVIKAVGESIKKAFDKKDFCARYGGDEFVCMVYGGVRDKIAEFYRLIGQEKYRIDYPLEVSLGTTEYEWLSDNGIDDVVKRANEIMRKQKQEKGGKENDRIFQE